MPCTLSKTVGFVAVQQRRCSMWVAVILLDDTSTCPLLCTKGNVQRAKQLLCLMQIQLQHLAGWVLRRHALDVQYAECTFCPSCAAISAHAQLLQQVAYLVWEARLSAVAMVSTYTSATDGGICLMSTAQGTSSLNRHNPALTTLPCNHILVVVAQYATPRLAIAVTSI